MSPDGDELEVIDMESSPPDATAPRRHGGPRRRIAIGAAGLLILGAAGAGIAIADAHHTNRSSTAATIVLPSAAPTAFPEVAPTVTTNAVSAFPDAEFVGQMGVISRGTGWALNGLALYETADNGAHWSNITPPDTFDPIGHIDTLDFLDADHAWVAVSIHSRPFTIWRTSTAGRSWQPLLPNVCGTAPPSTTPPCGAPVTIDFIDPQHGWALFSYPHSRSTLIATSDGGTTWSIVSRTPFVGPVHFVDQQTAWATSSSTEDRPGGAVYRTTDGGKTWSLIALPTGEAIGSLPLAVAAPQFLDRDDAVVARLVLRPANVRSIVVYRTSDGGRTWSAHSTPSLIQVRYTDFADYRFAAASASDWTLLVRSQLYVTHDAGQHWSAITPTHTRLVDIGLTSEPADAWVLACADGSATGCANEILFQTVDGGATWRVGSPGIGITANRLP